MLSSLKNSLLSTPVVLIILFLGIALGLGIDQIRHHLCYSHYAFINPSESCGPVDLVSKTGYISTQTELENYISQEKTAGRIIETSVYFRDLENGPIFGIRESADFAPASLLKLPLALFYLTQAERNPGILTEQLAVQDPQWSFTQTFPSSEQVNPNAPHTVEDLLMRMLTYSDNNAYGVLQTHVYESGQEDFLKQIFLELGFINPDSVTAEVMSVRRYASIFRALYNISFLNADLSEKVLSWLAASDFPQGIEGGVPPGIRIAHKFGERFTEDGTKQLHDCGIIYYPGNPYLLCVMTRGTNFDDLAAVIHHVSETVYREFDSRRVR
jgi:beta-lactamase class A